MLSRTLIIRADANVAIGTGHVIRCLALAQTWQDRGGEAIFAMAQSTPPLDEYLRSEHAEVFNLEATPGSEDDSLRLAQIARERSAEWIVIDGYQFKSCYQRAIKQAGFKLLLVDDTGESGPYCADIILNQNITACEELYAVREPETKLLLGSSYILLRREFDRWREWTRNTLITARSVLVAMGGTDPDALTLKVVRAFEKVHNSELQFKVIVGGSNPCIADLQRAAKELGSQVQLLTDVRDMASAMAQCDLAVICGGGTLWETLYMGCATASYFRPGVQRQINERVSAVGAILDLGPVEDFNEGKLWSAMKGLISSAQSICSMAEAGRRLVDGNGASRVIGLLG